MDVSAAIALLPTHGETHVATVRDLAFMRHQTLFDANSRYVWIPAQHDGVLRYDKKMDTWRRYTAADGLTNRIANIVADENDVWAYEWELFRYDAEFDRWTVIDNRRGLARAGIRELISGVDYLWVLHSRTLGRGGWKRVGEWISQEESNLASVPRAP